MAKKIKVKTKAVFNGEPVGATLEMDESTAKKYEALKYLEIVGEVKPKPKRKPAPKKTAQAKGKQAEVQKEDSAEE